MGALYERDHDKWLSSQIWFLKEKNFERLDIAHLVEEMEDLGKSQKRAIDSHLLIVLAHLIKKKYQPEYYSKSWQDSIDEGRAQIKFLIEDSPSLKNYPKESLNKCYKRAKQLAAKQTGIEEKKFSKQCPWNIKQIMEE